MMGKSRPLPDNSSQHGARIRLTESRSTTESARAESPVAGRCLRYEQSPSGRSDPPLRHQIGLPPRYPEPYLSLGEDCSPHPSYRPLRNRHIALAQPALFQARSVEQAQCVATPEPQKAGA